MLEKSHTHLNDTDVTRIKSVDTTDETTLNSNPFISLSESKIANEETTRIMSHADTGSQLVIGSMVKTTYQLIEVLGEGGMGTVFKALNKVWEEVEARDPYIAIKVLKPELSANKQLVRSLYSDFDRTKMLANCPNIIKVYGFDRDGSHVYMTMEYLSGQTLGDYLNHQPMNITQAWFIIEGIGNALAYAHENNIVHRDIKPGNIIITNEGLVKVLDFGIASKINENEGDETKFGGHELGALTVAYASPEMQRDYSPDARDDIYAFACVIYEIVTGKQFYKQKTPKARPIHGLNNRQMDILNKSLAFERELRTATIHELLDKLRPVKTPWLKYASIGSGIILTIGLAVWGIKNPVALQALSGVKTPVMPLEEKPVVVQPPIVSPPLADVPPADTVSVPPPQTPVAALALPSEPSLIIAPTPVIESSYSSTSSDGIAHLETSKSEYKNGESFHLSFTLTQPSYVRVIDRDTKGVESILRPNSRQTDKLLPANKEQVFPPKGFDIPVQGISGNNTVTIVASTRPFPKNIKLLNTDGSVSDQVQSGGYSWTQIHYTLHQ